MQSGSDYCSAHVYMIAEWSSTAKFLCQCFACSTDRLPRNSLEVHYRHKVYVASEPVN